MRRRAHRQKLEIWLRAALRTPPGFCVAAALLVLCTRSSLDWDRTATPLTWLERRHGIAASGVAFTDWTNTAAADAFRRAHDPPLLGFPAYFERTPNGLRFVGSWSEGCEDWTTRFADRRSRIIAFWVREASTLSGLWAPTSEHHGVRVYFGGETVATPEERAQIRRSVGELLDVSPGWREFGQRIADGSVRKRIRLSGWIWNFNSLMALVLVLVALSGVPSWPAWLRGVIRSRPSLRARRVRRGLCEECGYPVRGVRGRLCPECGHPRP